MFGTGFVANLSFSNGNSAQISSKKEAVKGFFRQHLGVSQKESNAFLTFVIPRQKEGFLKRTLGEFQDKQREFGVADIQLGVATLKEVFLNIARQAELETAAAEGRFATLTITSGKLTVLYTRGCKICSDTVTENAQNLRGVMVEVYWEQDDSGALCISGHSPETPVPINVQPTLPAAPQKIMGGRVALGLVIDPSQLSDSNSHS